MEATLTLHQAADRLGVEHTDLNRLIRIGALPEARKVNRPEGLVWVIDAAHLPAVASRNAWPIDLRSGSENTTAAETGQAGHDPVNTHPTDADLEAGHDAAGASSGTDTDTKTRPRMSSSVDGPSVMLDQPSVIIEAEEAAPSPADDTGALVPHRSSSPRSPSSDGGQELSPAAEASDRGNRPSAMEALDMALLDRLLASHEDRVAAQVKEQEARHALAALNEAHNRTTGELDIERRERMATAERYREERRARATADAKVAELRDRVAREMELAEAEKAEKVEAFNRSIEAERDAANAVALLGWRARRRYRKLSRSAD